MTWTWLLGLDFGIVDQNGISVIGWRPNDPCVYVAESYALTAIPSEMGREVKRLDMSYKFVRIVGDVGGQGKAFAAEMAARFTIPIEPAEKHNKAGFVALFNGDLKRGRIKVVRSKCSDLLTEWRDLPWAEGRNKEADGFANHCADATLYAWRAACAYHEREAPPPLTPAEQLRAEEAALVVTLEQEAEKEARGEWWEVG